MENDKEMEKILMNIKQGGGGIVSLLLFTAQMQMQLFVFLARMAKKAFIASGTLGKYQTFLAKTEGKFQIYNIPIPKQHAEKIIQLGEMEVKLEREKNRSVAKSLRKEIEALKKEIPELSQLEKLGISHYVLPKLNGGENSLQVAVAKNDIPNFKVWYLNHLNDGLSGGELGLGELKSFTEGNYSIFNLPFEGGEVQDMLHDFDVLGMNYSLLPDLKVGDGYTQVAVANKDQETLDGWFAIWKEKQIQEGKEARDYRKISREAYLETSEIDVEDYIAGTDQKYREADAEFSQAEGAVDVMENMGKETIKDDTSKEFQALSENPDYVKISINHETLVDRGSHRLSEETREIAEKTGQFLSRIPGTFGPTRQETLVLPKSRVFRTDEGKTYVGFLPKNGRTLVMKADGKFERRTFEEAYKPYDVVQRGFNKVQNMAKEGEAPGQEKSMEKPAGLPGAGKQESAAPKPAAPKPGAPLPAVPKR